jgi:hypothetical protein
MFLLFATVLCLAACGRSAAPRERGNGPYIPGGPVTGDTSDYAAAHAIENRILRLTPETRPIPPSTTINWGFNRELYPPDRYDVWTGRPASGVAHSLWLETWDRRELRRDLTERDVQHFLSTRFGVVLNGIHVDSVNSAVRQEAHIFLADAYNPAVPYRRIPNEMIRRYAPNYAALLDLHNGWEINRDGESGQRALNTFSYAPPNLETFSLYRLDTLENYGIAPPGPLTRVGEGVYFSPVSYNMSEFLHIIGRFTYCEVNTFPYTFVNPAMTAVRQNNIRAMVWAEHTDPFRIFAPIFGMFGVNTSIMEQDGMAMPFFATRAFRDALLFIEAINRQGAVFPRAWADFEYGYYTDFMRDITRIGWTSAHILDLPMIIEESQRHSPGRRFLITPPEAGNFRGAGANSTAAFNPNREAWYIHPNVCDDVLSRILNMFDIMSFDPLIHTIVRYGIYSESPYFDYFDTRNRRSAYFDAPRFRWSGEPYNSTILFNRNISFHAREGVFYTGVDDGITWQQWFLGRYEAVSAFAASEEGRALILQPSRVDPNNEFAEIRADLEEKYWDTLMQMATDYVKSIRTNELTLPDGTVQVMDVALTWNDYLMSLYNNGLLELSALYSQMPTREV